MPDIQITYRDPSTGLISLAVGRAPKLLTGMDALVQVVALSFLKNPGRDVIDRDEGSGLRALLGQYNLSSADEIKLTVVQQTRTVEQQIIARQGISGIPTERLKKLNILDVATNESGSQVVLKVQIISEAGESQDLLI